MSNARQVDLLLSGIFGLDGAPLSGGRVYCYNAGSSTPKNVYNDVGLTVASENPVVLDENGKGIKYALGSYKFVIKDANDSTLYTYDNLTYGFNPESVTADYSGSIYLAAMGGDSSSMQGSTTLTTPITSITEGMRFVFQSPFDCAANATIAIDNADAANLYISDGSGPVTAGYLEEGQFYEIIYDGSVFRVFSSSAEITVDRIPNGSIIEDKISTGAITTDKIANNAITNDKIASGAVTSSEIASNAVTNSKIDDYSITADKINSSAVTTYKLANKAVTNSKIDDKTIHWDKLQDRTSLENLSQVVTASTIANEGRIFYSCTANSGTVTLKVPALYQNTGSILTFVRRFSGATFKVEMTDNTGTSVYSSYTVNSYLILLYVGSNSWMTLHNV